MSFYDVKENVELPEERSDFFRATTAAFEEDTAALRRFPVQVLEDVAQALNQKVLRRGHLPNDERNAYIRAMNVINRIKYERDNDYVQQQIARWKAGEFGTESYSHMIQRAHTRNTLVRTKPGNYEALLASLDEPDD